MTHSARLAVRWRALRKQWRRWRNGAGRSIEEEAPIRAELFSTDQMEQHGRALAADHSVGKSAGRDLLLKRLDENEQVLSESCVVLANAVRLKSRIAPAGEWLLDNSYLIDEQIRTAKRHLPKGYSRELPLLTKGPSAGLPRVYDLALEVISHGDGRVDAETLYRFVAAYQAVVPLALGELWAIPIMLRLALIESLRRVAARIARARDSVNLAEDWSERMIEIADRDPKSLILVIADMARSKPPMVSAFVAELARRLQGQGPALALPLTWIEQRLVESSLTIELMVLAENQQQAADQVSISNSIGSLRFLAAMDWRVFVENMSCVEQALLKDFGHVHGSMDFATRDRYRHVVDRLGKECSLSELEIARSAIGLAAEYQGADAESRKHVGYYLIDAGLAQLELMIKARIPLLERLRRALGRYPRTVYLGGIFMLTAGVSMGLIRYAQGDGLQGWRLLLWGGLCVIMATQFASAITNWLATLVVSPKTLPRMDYGLGVPVAMRTLVVVPTLIQTASDIDELIEALEVRFLGNRDDNVYFGLLTDLRDGHAEHLNEDAALVERTRKGIEALNLKYPAPATSRFWLFHRGRRWNPAENVWMGYERKRGKLADLNAWLRGQGDGRFALITGEGAVLAGVRYVITLDTDTQLPRESARQLIGVMAHPLNRPRFDEQARRVIAGYGILQPRMAASLAGSVRSRYAELCGSEPGIDPYTRSVSDVYQDVFGEGSFIGKGIYDVDAFERTLEARLPENKILSHDLLEGCYARSGLISDVQLYEDYPERYEADVSRQQRWIRGDWQITQWLLPWVPGVDGRAVRNPLTALSRWKILDNLRRSLVPAATLWLFLLAWAFAPQAGSWVLGLLGVALLPPALVALVDALRKPLEVRWLAHWGDVLRGARHAYALVAFRLACLPYEAWFGLVAVVRTAWRMLVGKRHLLEWKVSTRSVRRVNALAVAAVVDPHLGRAPAAGPLLGDAARVVATADRGAGVRAGLGAAYQTMWVSPVAVGLAVALGGFESSAAVGALPLLCMWLAAPGLVWWLGQPRALPAVQLQPDQLRFLHSLARRTWAFFDRYVGPEDHWLPPDNFQENPGPIVAHRTSPTNIGMALLANLAASDFGYISPGRLLARSAQTLDTLAAMERYQGHFYNWYDTRTLEPLPPRYVSAVDSGNLAGHLLTLRAGVLAVPDQSLLGARLFDGIGDTLNVLAEVAGELPQARMAPVKALIEATRVQPPTTLPALLLALDDVVVAAIALVGAFPVLPDSDGAYWSNALLRQCEDALDELKFLAPWLVPPPVRASISSAGAPVDDLLRHALLADYCKIPTLRELQLCALTMVPAIDERAALEISDFERNWLLELRAMFELGSARAGERIACSERLGRQIAEFANMQFGFLYDSTRHLLAVGYNVDQLRRDTSYYDLLASESRLGSFVAIAQGQLPQESWFALGRLLTSAGGEPILVSWSGSMFEYLMPLLVMPAYAGTLLDQTCKAAVARQIAYGAQRSLPWGVSESGYNTFDASLNYQYHAFGVPGLGLSRGLADDQVVAPYASALALMVAPEAACANLQRLAQAGLAGRFGLYEAIDYTPARLSRGQNAVVVRSFMAHHQGMTLLSLAYLLLDQPMQKRFESDPEIQSTLLLLQERIPKHSALHMRASNHADGSAFVGAPASSVQAPMGAFTPTPEVQLLSNGRYHVMVTNAGGGYSRWRDLAVTRWREDSTCDNWGAFVYLRDVASGEYWSAAHQPTLKRAQSYEAMFSEGRAEFRRNDLDIETHTEIVVSPEDDIELRRVHVTNRSRATRTIEITSYAEVVLALPAADMTQPAFGNLFVQTEIVPGRRAILCTRRPRSLEEATPWMFHLLATNGTTMGEVSFETDRMRFVGRGQTLVAPLALQSRGALSGTAGSVLDPIVAIRCLVTLGPQQSAAIDLVTGAAPNREACMGLVDKYQDRHLADRVLDLASTHGGVTLRQINAGEADAQMFRRLAGSVLYADSAMRAEAAILLQNRRGQSGLWGYAISGDLPIVLLKIADSANIEMARQMIQCHAYWRLKGVAVDLVIWNEDHIGYRQRLQDQILGLIATGIEANSIDRPGGIYVRCAEQISSEDRILLQTVARVIVADSRGPLLDQVNRPNPVEPKVARLIPVRTHRAERAVSSDGRRPELILGNDLGGFSADGSEYLISISGGQTTPLPWVNVLANARIGTVVSESGLAYTWSENAHEFRLTPWSPDSVGASSGEAIYLRDEETGHYWSPSPLPSSGAMPYLTRHGFGYSVFEHTAGGIRSELWIYVDLHEAVKYSVLRVRNGSGRTRRLSATGYVEWVLGDLRSRTAMHVVTSIDRGSGALFAHNAYHTEFSDRVAFFDVDDMSRTLSGDRGEFLGRNGSLAQPDALTRARLSGHLGAGLDPCGAIQVPFELADGQEREIIFRLGAGRDLAEACALALRLRKPGTARAALEQVRSYWKSTLGAVSVQTPDPALNVLTNGWLLYQTLSSRIHGRSGYYQSGGAYGFRDQLQDCMALVHAQPQMLREHLLRCAARQYPQGDVQHWWHPPVGRGVRTRCSDDYLWLPLATCRYVLCSGDSGVLDETVGFLEGRSLNADEESYYDLPGRSTESATLYEHCVRAIKHGLRFGVRGLPLIGSGDWNDGMNLVGIGGRGESVWLGFFLHEVLQRFASIARMHGDADFAQTCTREAESLRANLAEHAWDGDWYKRAWFDDGTPLGSAENPECSIDSIAQSWSVLSGGGEPERARLAMAALDRHLVRRDARLVQLLDPPFDHSTLNPGYIKGYVPGVRENGGQYTHAAIWAAMAYAQLGDARRAWELLDLINPITHTLTAADVAVYRAEPYVVAADVYAMAPHTGRGGWTWYTGSAAWLYRLITESLLGLNRDAGWLRIAPCLPADWPHYSIRYRFGQSVYVIAVEQIDAAEGTLALDGAVQAALGFALIDDGLEHAVQVRLARPPTVDLQAETAVVETLAHPSFQPTEWLS